MPSKTMPTPESPRQSIIMIRQCLHTSTPSSAQKSPASNRKSTPGSPIKVLQVNMDPTADEALQIVGVAEEPNPESWSNNQGKQQLKLNLNTLLVETRKS